MVALPFRGRQPAIKQPQVWKRILQVKSKGNKEERGERKIVREGGRRREEGGGGGARGEHGGLIAVDAVRGWRLTVLTQTCFYLFISFLANKKMNRTESHRFHHGLFLHLFHFTWLFSPPPPIP